MRRAAAIILATSLFWGVYRFGVTEPETQYRLFLFFLLATFLVMLRPFAAGWSRLTAALLWGIGCALLAQVALRGPVTGQGYLIAALGWLAFFVVFSLSSSHTRARLQVAYLLIAVGAAEALVGLLQSLGGIDYIGSYYRDLGRVATGTYINHNHFAGLLNMTIPLAVGLGAAGVWSRRDSSLPASETLGKIWVGLIGCAAMGLAVVLSVSRAGVTAFLFTLLFLIGLLLTRRTNPNRAVVTVALLLLVTLGLALLIGVDGLTSRFQQLDSSLQQRLTVYRDSARLVADHPWGGVGPHMFQWRFRAYQSLDARLWWKNAHNDYLQSAAEWGIPLAALFWSFVLWVLSRAILTFWRSRQAGDKGLALGCAGSIFAILVHSFFDFNLQIPANLVVFSTILALALMGRQQGISCASARVPAGSPAAFAAFGRLSPLRWVLMTLILAAGWNVFGQLMALELVRRADTPGQIQAALKWDSRQPQTHLALGLMLRDHLEYQDLAAATGHLLLATDLHPDNWHYWLELARIYEIRQLSRRAEHAYLQAVKLNPSSGSYSWKLAHYYLRQRKETEALAQIRKSLQLDPGFRVQALPLLSRLQLPYEEVRKLWPTDQESLLMLLVGLVRTQIAGAEVAGLAALWDQILASSEPLPLARAAFYTDYLLAKSPQIARQQWIQLQAKARTVDPDFSRKQNLVWNGHFEFPISGTTLGWMLGPKTASSIRSVAGEGRDGSTALRLDFDGTSNPRLVALQQTAVPVAGIHAFSFWSRSQDLTSDQGLFLEVIAEPSGQVLARSSPVVSTTPWQQHIHTLHIADSTERLLIRLRRDPSQRIDNRLAGTFWIDSVAIHPFPKSTPAYESLPSL